MVNHSPDSLGAIFGALADPTRRAILERLTHGDASVKELAEPFQVSLPAISKQLRVLEQAGLLTREKQGRVRRCRLEAEPLREAAWWLARYRRYWERQLDSLGEYLAELQNEEPNP